MVIFAGAVIFYVRITVAEREVYGRKKPKKWRKEHERYFNETIIRSRCSLWTSDKKMEPQNVSVHFH